MASATLQSRKPQIVAAVAAPVFFAGALLVEWIEMAFWPAFALGASASFLWPLVLGLASKVHKQKAAFFLGAVAAWTGAVAGVIVNTPEWWSVGSALFIVVLFGGLLASYLAVFYTGGAILAVLLFGKTAI